MVESILFQRAPDFYQIDLTLIQVAENYVEIHIFAGLLLLAPEIATYV